MSRTSKLHVLARLVRHEEGRALKRLAELRGQLDAQERRISALHGQIAESGRRTAAPGLRLSAADLVADERHRAALRQDALGVTRKREETRVLEAAARENVIRARLRVRAVEHAIERREAREKLERSRAQTRRIDEMVRSRLALREDSDALA